MDNYKKYKDHFTSLKSARKTWDTMYQTLGEYISLTEQNFEGQPANGEFLYDEVFDSKGAYAAINSASVLSGMLWQGSAAQSIYIKEPSDLENPTTEEAEYYDYITNKIVNAFDDPRAGFLLAWDEYMLDQIIFGTSGIGVEAGTDSLLKFSPYGVKEMYIDEGARGKVTDIFLFYEWPVKRVVSEYGIDNVTDKVKQKYEQGKLNDTVKILVCLVPREHFKAEAGALAMPIMSLHMEYDSCHALRESGYSELPIKVARFRKLNYEKYGRSNGMFALSDIKEKNILAEMFIVATEKSLDMPKGVMNDSVLGSTIDTSAGAINVFNATAVSGNANPIFDIGTVPNVQIALERMRELDESIAQHFYIDRLLDFNNDTQMTFGEAQIRAGRSNASLAGLFARQINEAITPTVDRGVNILFQMGELGVIKGSEQHRMRVAEGKEFMLIPDRLIERLDAGQDIYNIGYRTQASNASRSEEYIAIIDVIGFTLQAMQVDPDIRLRVDLDEAVKRVSDIRGLPVGIIREDDEVQQMKEAQAQAQQSQQEMMQMQAGADVVEKLASANQAVRD